MLGLPLGGIEGELDKKAQCHIFVASKAGWYDIDDDLLKFEGFPDSTGNIHR